MLAHQVKVCQAIQENRTDTKDRYKYQKIMHFQEKQYKLDFKLFIIINRRIGTMAGK